MSTAQAHFASQNWDAHSRRALSAWSLRDLMATPSTLQATLAVAQERQ